MQNNVLRMALGIYEQEIVFFGGSVTYSGKILRRGLFSFIEEAEICLDGIKCTVLMERYKDGSAIIYDSKNGMKKFGCQYFGYDLFLHKFFSLSQNSAKHLSFYFFRRVKIFSLALLQLFCIICAITSGIFMLVNSVSSVSAILLLSASLVFILIQNSYTYVRVDDVFSHSSFLLTHKSGDESDDFWNI